MIYNSQTDTERLRSLLSLLVEDLSLNFLERRSKNKNHKSSVLEELQDVINELNSRERDLQAAVGIALMVIDTNESLKAKVSKVKSKLMQALEKSHHQAIDIESLKNALLAAEERNEQINKTLVETEETMLINSAELNRIVRERFREANIGASEEEIELIKKDFRSQLENVQKKRWELEKEIKSLNELNKNCDKEIYQHKENIVKLETRLEKLLEKFKKTQKSKKNYKEEVAKLDSELKIINSSYQRLKIHSERLEEEISILEIKETPIKTQLNHASSLHSELEIMIDQDELIYQTVHTQGDEPIEDTLFMKPTHSYSKTPNTPQTRTSSLVSYFKMFSTCQETRIDIFPAKHQRQNPPEEYFSLTLQAVKLNCPHVEHILHISTQKLYEQALKEGIPFHKWHIWIESYLNTAYVQQLYKKNNIWKRYSHNICL